MPDLAMYLSGARAMLRMSTKSVARALQISDNAVTKLETQAHDQNESKVKHLISYYEDLGLHFQREDEREDGRIIWIAIKDVKKLVLSAKFHPNPEDSINQLLREMRYIGGLIYNFKTIDKTKASRYDSIEMHFPITMRGVARQILESWCETEEPLDILYPDGLLVGMDMEKIDDLLGTK